MKWSFRVVRSAALFFSVIVAGTPGCRFISSDEDEPAFFEATVAEVDVRGTSQVTIESGELRVRGEFLHSDSTTRFLDLNLPDFAGEGTYALERTAGIYGVVDSIQTVQYGYSSGREEDQVRISAYDEDEGFIRGEFFFYAEAFVGFNGVDRHEPFTVSGRFRGDLE